MSWLILFSCGEANQKLSTDTSQKTFTAIPSSHSGITFKNQLNENLSTGENILDFDFFFNGAGLAIADFDNDGLEDIFFAGNQVENRIYKNEGDLKFSDKTQTAGVNPPAKRWSNGVSIADVNQDGLLDIYISQGGPNGPEKRQNLLLINQGDFIFLEKATTYGLQDKGISTQAAFFDYDNDGDLDCFVMNESPLIGFDPVAFYSMMRTHSNSLLHTSSSHLYKNEGGRFVDVSDQAGVLLPSFGLGLCVSDINNDGWLDIYVANDYYIPDAIYLNDQSGGFTNGIKDVVHQSSFYSMGVDIADIDNDGHQDIYILDMASKDHIKSKTLMASMDVENFDLLTKQFDFPYQYMYNTLQLNNGQDQFNNIAHLSGTAKTDWSWAGIIEDFDLDGYKEIFVSNGYRKYARDNDFQKRVNDLKAKYGDAEIPLAEKETLYATVPSEKLANVFFKQKSPYRFEDVAAQVGLNEASFSNGAAFGDLDNDGDLDLIINNIDSEAFLYENTSSSGRNNYLKVKVKSKLSESFAKVKIYYQDQVQVSEAKKVRGYLSSQPNDIIFGLGETQKIDSLIVNWQNSKSQKMINIKTNQTIELVEENAKSALNIDAPNKPLFDIVRSGITQYKHLENGYNDFKLESLLPYKQSINGPQLRIVDKDKIFISGSADSPSVVYDLSNNSSQEFATPNSEIVDAIFFDLEGDGDQDVYLVAGGNEHEANSQAYTDQVWINVAGTYTKDNTQGVLNPGTSGKTGLVIDYDKDGDEDLIICNRIIPKQYPQHAGSIILANEGGLLKDVAQEVAASLKDFGIINDIQALDFNADGWMDFMVVGEWTGIGLFQNNEGKFEDVSQSYGLDKSLGWWFSISPTDINADGKQDYIIGNLGLNSKYKATKEKPLSIYGYDFDQNGSYDQVLSYTYKGKEVPFRGRQCSSEQMPFIAEKFESYESFANATLKDVYGEELEKATQKKATDFSSIALISKDGGFEIQSLPIEAQFHPILDGVSTDLNKDGFEDLILIGNIYETEVETPRLDYANATVLLSNGKGYEFSSRLSNQLKINGNAKSVELVTDVQNNRKLLIGVNGVGILEIEINN